MIAAIHGIPLVLAVFVVIVVVGFVAETILKDALRKRRERRWR